MENLYKSPISIPKGKIGKFEIKHKLIKPGEDITIVSMRDAIFSGKKAQQAIATTPIIMHQLFETGQGLWMTDSPQEQALHEDVIAKCEGNVLIGGLGLGYIAKMLANKPSVEFVTVIEKEQDVIDLVWKHLKIENGVVIHADLFDYLAKTKEKFDWAYYDIWTPTGEDILYTHVRPLKTLSRKKVPFNHILCWAEATMLGQMWMNIYSSIQFMNDSKMGFMSLSEKEFQHSYKFSRTHWTFYNWMRQTKPTKEDAIKFAKHYCQTYTDHDKWAEVWGVWER